MESDPCAVQDVVVHPACIVAYEETEINVRFTSTSPHEHTVVFIHKDQNPVELILGANERVTQ